MPIISVIIPIYNSEKYLSICLDSVIGQDFKDIEILCIDDGSTDKSPDILREYADRDSRIKIITQKNTGGSSARNTGIEHAAGLFVEFVDSDDILASDTISAAYTEATSKQVDLVFFNFARFTGKPTIMAVASKIKPKYPASIYNKDNYSDRIFNDFAIITWNKLIRTSILIENGIKFDEKLSHNHDVDFSIRLMLVANTYSYLDKIGYYYRNDNKNSLTVTKRSDPTNVLKILVNLSKIIDKTYKPLKQSFNSYAIDMTYGTLEKYREDRSKYEEVLNFSNNILLPKLGIKDIQIADRPITIRRLLRKYYDALQSIFAKIAV